MATDSTRSTLKSHFNTGDKPTQQNFYDLIESTVNLTDTTTVTGVVTLSSDLKVGANIQSSTNGTDTIVKQFDGTEVARVHDGAVVPTAAGTSTSLSAGTGLGSRRRVLTLGSGNDDNTLTLTAADSGCVVFVTPTNAVTLILPLIGTETGFWCTVVLADKISKAFKIRTSGTDNADLFYMYCQTTADDGATADVAGDVITFSNALEGSHIELLNVAGGAAERWVANVTSLDTVASLNDVS
tara:strand:+ start:1144 stop:1866 length:723 start_codon:yes stop_codon:yes gene_type:complete